MQQILEKNISVFAAHVLALDYAVNESQEHISVVIIWALKMLFDFILKIWPVFRKENRHSVVHQSLKLLKKNSVGLIADQELNYAVS